MASKRMLKKAIRAVSGELFADCVVQYKYVPGTNKAAAEVAMGKVIDMQNDLIGRISHPEPGNVKGSYQKIKADFAQQVSALVEEIQKL